MKSSLIQNVVQHDRAAEIFKTEDEKFFFRTKDATGAPFESPLFETLAGANLQAREMMREFDGRVWAAKHFGIPVETVRWHNSGICYDRIGVTTEEAAKIVSEKVKNQTVNGGWFHGMPLGGYSALTDANGATYYDVMC